MTKASKLKLPPPPPCKYVYTAWDSCCHYPEVKCNTDWDFSLCPHILKFHWPEGVTSFLLQVTAAKWARKRAISQRFGVSTRMSRLYINRGKGVVMHRAHTRTTHQHEIKSSDISKHTKWTTVHQCGFAFIGKCSQLQSSRDILQEVVWFVRESWSDWETQLQSKHNVAIRQDYFLQNEQDSVGRWDMQYNVTTTSKCVLGKHVALEVA